MNYVEELVSKIKNGYLVQKEDAIKLLEYDVNTLSEGARELKDYFFDDKYELCAIINGKSGKCSENCKFCAQSCFYKTKVEEYSMIDSNTAVEDAKKRHQEGIVRYSIVTSGRKLSKKELGDVSKIYKDLTKNVDINLCASHGLLEYDDFVVLKDSGVKRYHNNLETSRNNFPNICTTHTYDDKIRSIKAAQRAGLSVCSGGIFGLGETMEDRIDMILDLRELGVDSIPLNVLNSIEGTPFAKNGLLPYKEVIKSMAIARFIIPNKVIRLAGGRGLLFDKGKKLFKNVVNGAISGDLLTTAGTNTEYDKNMLKSLGKTTGLL